MTNLEKAKQFLADIEMPSTQQSEMCCYVLLAMASLKKNDSWRQAKNEWIRIHDIIQFIAEHHGRLYAENSRETIRKQALHHFRNAALIEDNGKATNSPLYRYRLTAETLVVLKKYSSKKSVISFLSKHESLTSLYASKKRLQKIPVKINGVDLTLSTGKHNLLQKAIVEEFGARFAPGSTCLYLGDTTDKELVKEVAKLEELGFEITLHDKMPDVVLYREDRNWLYFIEAVTSVGPMSPKRIKEIKEMTTGVSAGQIYVTAFLDFATYKKFSTELAWDTEVWISEMPDHMIHLNGDKFLGPR